MYRGAMEAVGQALMSAADAILADGARAQLDFEGSNCEFAQRLSDTMASYGAAHLQALSAPGARITFMQQVCFNRFESLCTGIPCYTAFKYLHKLLLCRRQACIGTL